MADARRSRTPSWEAVLREPLDAVSETDALADAIPLSELADYDEPSAPSYLERVINESPPYRAQLGGDAYMASGCLAVFGEQYLPISARTLRPTRNPWPDFRRTLLAGDLWDHDNRARIEGPEGPVSRCRRRRARVRLEAGIVTAYVDGHRAELEVLTLQVYGLFFLLRLHTAEIAQRLRRSRAAIVQVVGRLRIAAGIARPMRRSACQAAEQTLHTSPPHRVGSARIT